MAGAVNQDAGIARAPALLSQRWASQLRAHAGLMLIVACHLLLAKMVAAGMGQSVSIRPMLTMGISICVVLCPIFLAVLLIGSVARAAFVERPRHPLQWLLAEIRLRATDPDRLVGGSIVLGLVLIFMSSFTVLKAAIPILHPFAWDAALAQADAALHFGAPPWEWLWPVLGNPFATTAINAAYNIWFFVLYFIILYEAFSGSDLHRRMRFLVAFMFTWGIGGNVLATVFSSAGPVYYDRLGLGATFEPLMAGLRRLSEVAPVWSLSLQDILWSGYTGRSNQIVGISAMPSMHMASSVLFALWGFSRSRLAGWCLSAYAAVIMLGSVHLGWHYAIDGYAGALIAVLCWRAADWFARQSLARR